MLDKIHSIKKSKVKPSTILILGLLLLISLSYVRIKVEQIKIGYNISENNKKEKSLLKERQILKAEFMKLSSPKRLEFLAQNIGFKFPTQNDIIYIEEQTIVGIRE